MTTEDLRIRVVTLENEIKDLYDCKNDPPALVRRVEEVWCGIKDMPPVQPEGEQCSTS